jgi:hypothetical protein
METIKKKVSKKKSLLMFFIALTILFVSIIILFLALSPETKLNLKDFNKDKLNEIVSPDIIYQVIPITTWEKTVKDLKLNRIGDKLNITWEDKFVTIKGYFYYLGDNKTYTFQEASTYGVTYNYWVDKVNGEMKFGGVVNLTNSPQAIKNKGFYVVFELIDKSENVKLRLDGGKLWLDDNVAIDWKDRVNEENDFEIYNKTIVFMRYKYFNSTDNQTYYSAYHNTVFYDPIITYRNLCPEQIFGYYNPNLPNIRRCEKL